MKFIKFNINKVFPFLPLKFKLIIAFALLSSVPLFIVGIIGIFNNIDKMKEIALENLSHDVSISNERAQNFISNVNTDIGYLIKNKSLNRLISSTESRANNKSDWDLYSSFILNFAKTHTNYYQFRFINSSGDEKLRIQKVSKDYIEYGNDSLNQGGFEFYFNLTKDSKRYMVRMIPAELTGPGNSRVAAISFAVRISDQKNQFEGIFIADVFAREFFKVIEQKTHLKYGKEVAIIDSEGRYLYDSNKKKNWNRLLAERSSDNIFNKYSLRFTQDIISGNSGIQDINSEEIIAYAPLFISQFSGGKSYFIYESVNQKYIIGPAKRFAIISGGVILLFLIISITFGTIATNQIARPIRELKKGAEIISEGNYSHQLYIQTNDEIEQLAFQFNKMAIALNERDQLLQKNREELEKIVIERTRELGNEKEKLQAVLDNVPSAFILMDNECRIISASNAIRSIANLNPDELPGKKCSDIFENSSFCGNCQLKGLNKNQKHYTFVESKSDTYGEEKFIEHTTIPIMINHNKNAVLEILTDVTERKKMDEHLLKLQKLLTIGETSALIAHQIRNSLTSVKMLLQLQRENSFVKEDINSLDFSLESIQRMESVINNLLKLGQQVDYKLTKVSIIDIVDDCLMILKPRIDKNNIKLTKEIDPDIPDLFMDTNQFQETVTNLLINSIQAIGTNGEIKIYCKLRTLTNNLSDFGYIDKKLNDRNNSGYKIKLPKGERIVSVEVFDSGKGIPHKDLNKIFDPFFTTKENGSGLGLAMVKKTVNNHGGIVQVKSEEGKGTLIKLLLPIRENI